MRDTDAKAREIYESGLGSAEVGRLMGLSSSGVLKKVRRAGGQLRRPGQKTKDRGWHVNGHGYIFDVISPNWVFAAEMARPIGTLRKDGTRRSLRVLRHRRIMAEHLNRPLRKDETVHHINGDKLDNRLENLQLRQGQHGSGAAFRCNCCGSSDIGPDRI